MIQLLLTAGDEAIGSGDVEHVPAAGDIIEVNGQRVLVRMREWKLEGGALVSVALKAERLPAPEAADGR